MTASEICDKLKSTIESKNAAYGEAAASPPIFAKSLSPEYAILIRMSDKVSRLASLLANPCGTYDEGIDDTVLDLAGYCVLLLANRNK